MGVRSLETYLEKKFSEYCYRASIQRLADKYRNETGKTPLILVDGPNSLRNIVSDNDPHWILGGQLKAFVELSTLLVTSFKVSVHWNMRITMLIISPSGLCTLQVIL